MDEQSVRAEAQRHAEATVAGDLKTAGSSLDKSAYAAAGDVMKKMPEPLESCEVTTAEQRGDAWAVQIVYSGGGSSTTVESTWEDRDGRPKIVGLQAL